MRYFIKIIDVSDLNEDINYHLNQAIKLFDITEIMLDEPSSMLEQYTKKKIPITIAPRWPSQNYEDWVDSIAKKCDGIIIYVHLKDHFDERIIKLFDDYIIQEFRATKKRIIIKMV